MTTPLPRLGDYLAGADWWTAEHIYAWLAAWAGAAAAARVFSGLTFAAWPRKRPAKGTPTAINLFALGDTFKAAERVPNAIPPTRAPHIRRCLKAGLLVVEGGDLVLTPAGRKALARRRS